MSVICQPGIGRGQGHLVTAQILLDALPRPRLTLGKMTTWLTPSERASATFSSSPWRQPRRSTPGMEAMGRFCSPSCTKTGRIRFAGEMWVSLMAARKAPLRRLRRGRDGRSCGGGQRTQDRSAETAVLPIHGHKCHVIATHLHGPSCRITYS